MNEKTIWIIELTDALGLKNWRRYIIMNVSGINNKFPKPSLILCEDFIKGLNKFNIKNTGGIILQARIVSQEEVNNYVPDIEYGKVIMLNPVGLIFDEMMVLYLRYDLELELFLLPAFLGLGEATIGNTFSNSCDKNNIPKGDSQQIKNVKAMNDYKYDFPGGFFPILRIIR
jgi:hypothetical protein